MAEAVSSLLVADDGRIRSGWVVTAFVVIATVFEFLFQLPAVVLHFAVGDLSDPRLALVTAPTLLSGLVATAVCVRVFREPFALGRVGDVRLGFALGAAALAAGVLGPVAVGAGTLGGPEASVANIAWSGALQVFTIGATSVGEELLFRGVAFGALARGTRPWVAVVATSVVFGAAHWRNPNASFVASLNVALVGVWFGLLRHRRSLWASIGLHLSWNWFEGFVFGQPVSGLYPGASLMVASWPRERGFWSGGDFGPEASGWVAVVLVVATGLTWVFAKPRPGST